MTNKDYRLNKRTIRQAAKNLSEWVRCGVERGYEQRNSERFNNDEGKDKRPWYVRGREVFLDDFAFR